MNILITGGSGFIGSHLVDILIENGHNVINYDIENPRYKQDCRYVKGDVMDFEMLKRSTEKIDFIYHLVAEANVNNFFNSPVYSNQVTSASTVNVLECAKINKVQRVLLASTEWIYGNTDDSKNDEITELTKYTQHPEHLYTASKISAELSCKAYKKLYDVDYTIMRYGIPFGERAREETVTPIFINKIINNQEITIHGNGTQTRQFIYVKELVKGNRACMKEEAANEIFNINGNEVISVLDVIKNLEAILDIKAKIKFIEDRKGNYKGRFISSQKAKEMLGWECTMKYKEALANYVKNYLKEKKN